MSSKVAADNLDHATHAEDGGVPVYPRENPSFARPAARYRGVLIEAATFEATTIETPVEVQQQLYLVAAL